MDHVKRIKSYLFDRDLHFFDVIWLFISIVGLLNILLLLLNSFIPLLSIGISVVITLGIIFLLKIKVRFSFMKISPFLVPAIILAIFLRVPPNLYLTGGQDQGTYVSLSKQYEINKGLYIEDKLRSKISEEAKSIYDYSNHFLGVEMKDAKSSEFVMPFYPMLPSWLATFGVILGSDNSVWAVTFFGIISILGVYLLTLELSNGKKGPALLAAFLLTINPLHVYFSRIALTEVVALTAFLLMFYYLVKFYRKYQKKEIKIYYLILSLLAANFFFYTRMSALLMIPFIVLLPVIPLIYGNNRNLGRYLAIYSLSWVLTFVISYLFYYFFLPNLFLSISHGRILDLINSGTVISSIMVMGCVLLIFFNKLKILQVLQKNSRKILEIIHWVALVIFIIFIGYAIYDYGRYVFIENSFSILSKESLSYLKQSSILTTLLYLSPFGFIALPISFIYYRDKSGALHTLILLLLLIFLCYCWGILSKTPYHYYFARYQISEFIPLCVIYISIFFCDLIKKRMAQIIFVTILTFTFLVGGYFSYIQHQSVEGANVVKTEEFVKKFTSKDLILVSTKNFSSFNQIILPLKYYYNLNILPISSTTAIDNPSINALKSEFDSVYILTTYPSLEQTGITLVKEVNFEHNYLVHCNREDDAYFAMEGHSPDIPLCRYIIIPNRFYYGSYKMYLYLWK